jgi:hypothetical protein
LDFADKFFCLQKIRKEKIKFKAMTPVPTSEMLDELAVDVMDLQSILVEESKTKHKQLIRKYLDKIYTTKRKYSPVPEFEQGKDEEAHKNNLINALIFRTRLVQRITTTDIQGALLRLNCHHRLLHLLLHQLLAHPASAPQAREEVSSIDRISHRWMSLGKIHEREIQ